MNKAQATALTAKIRGSIVELEANLQKFIDAQGWLAMEYNSFTSWWDEEIGTLRLGAAVKNVVISLMLLERVGKPRFSGRRVLDRHEIVKVKALRANKWTIEEIARELHTSTLTVNRILDGVYVPIDERGKNALEIARAVGASQDYVRNLDLRLRQPPSHRRLGYAKGACTDLAPEEAKRLALYSKHKAMTKADVLRIAVAEFLDRQEATAPQ